MKRIIAFVKQNMLEDVIFSLHEVDGFLGASISEVQEIGCGSMDHSARGDRNPLHTYLHQMRLEMICPDSQVEELVALISRKAHTGLPEDGRIVVSPVEDVIEIRTGASCDSSS